MAKHPLVEELEKEHRSKQIRAIIVFVFIVVGITVFYFSQNEPSSNSRDIETTGTILSHPPSGTINTSPHYRVRLDSGAVVKARGLGKVPPSYTGKVRLKVESGNLTGTNVYHIIATEPSKDT